MGRAWQVWMMSTQRREERSTLATVIRRVGLWMRSLTPAALAQRATRRREARLSSAFAGCKVKSTAHASLGSKFPADVDPRKATKAPPSPITANSLLTEIRDQQPDCICPGVSRPGQASAFRPPLQRSSGYRPLHFPAFRAFVHPALPRVPVAVCNRTERYDGKRDLYFQHAA